MLILRWCNCQVTQLFTNLAAEFDSGDTAYRKDIFLLQEIILLQGYEWAEREAGHSITMERYRRRETAFS